MTEEKRNKVINGLTTCAKLSARYCPECPYDNPEKSATCGKQLDNDAIQLIFDLEKELSQYEWRLCSKELPDDNSEVLITYIVNGNYNKRYVEASSYFDGLNKWISVNDEYRTKGTNIDVIAWMPMPTAHKGDI